MTCTCTCACACTYTFICTAVVLLGRARLPALYTICREATCRPRRTSARASALDWPSSSAGLPPSGVLLPSVAAVVLPAAAAAAPPAGARCSTAAAAVAAPAAAAA
eukprot:scaffold58221_cov44-Phaeocystis_antarctica.AAC.2